MEAFRINLKFPPTYHSTADVSAEVNLNWDVTGIVHYKLWPSTKQNFLKVAP